MASTFTTNLRLEIQVPGENRASWGDKANTVFELIEEAITGYADVPMADANVTLTAFDGVSDQARQMFLKFTGTMTANRDVVLPAGKSKLYIVNNRQLAVLSVSSRSAHQPIIC